MENRERAHRIDPERQGPIRNWNTLYRGATKSADVDTDTPGRDSSDSDTIAEAVDLGYRVIEEHIRQGSDHAGTRNGESPGSTEGNREILRIVQRMLRCYMDLGALWMEVADTVLGNPEITESIMKKMRAVTGEERDGHNPQQVQIVIDAPRPVEVELSLDGAAAGGDLAVHAPRVLDDTTPPLSQVEFDSAADGVPGCLRVRVEANQPAGVYTGVIVERATHRSRGTLTIRVPD